MDPWGKVGFACEGRTMRDGKTEKIDRPFTDELSRFLKTETARLVVVAAGKAYAEADPDLKGKVDIGITDLKHGEDREPWRRQVAARRPHLVGFSCYVWNISETLSLIRRIHRQSPETYIVLGGPEVGPKAAADHSTVRRDPADRGLRGRWLARHGAPRASSRARCARRRARGCAGRTGGGARAGSRTCGASPRSRGARCRARGRG